MAYAFANGSGTASDPYLVETAADLNGVRDYVSAHFRQVADIDLSVYENWEPIGDYPNVFTGTYDGDNHEITNLTVTGENSLAGLFSAVLGATLKNIKLRNVDISLNHRSGGFCGGLAALFSDSTAINCSVTGNVSVNISSEGEVFAGGIIGFSGDETPSTITDCFNACSVSCSVLSGEAAVAGGIVGFCSGLTITNCYNIGNISSSSKNYMSVAGGLIGYGYPVEATNCFNQGNVSGEVLEVVMYDGSCVVGGFSGLAIGKIINCYSTGSVSGVSPSNLEIGGLVGFFHSDVLYKDGEKSCVISSYYDTQTSGCTDTGKGEPKTTAEMKQQATFEGWDFDKYWSITDSYPFLTPVHYAKGAGVVAYTGTAVQSPVFVLQISANITHTATGSGAVFVLAKGVGEVAYFSTARASKRLEISGLADTNVRFFNMLDVLYLYNGQEYYYYNDENSGPVTDIAYIPTLTLGRAPTGGGTAFEDLNYLSNSWKDSFSGTTDATGYTLSFSGLSDTPVKAWVNGELKEEVTDFTVDRATGIVSFNSPPGEGTDNVVIQAEKANLMNPAFIKQATQFIIYGGKNDNRVFACRGNTRYHSGLNDPTYWPESNYAVITSDAENLVGFGKMYDYLINLKENSLTFTTIDSDPGGEVIFPIYPLNDEYGCLAPDSIQPVANGLIFLAQTATGAPAGVVYLSPTTVRNQLNVRVISEDINKSVHAGITGLTEYSKAELAAAKSYIHDKKYWLRVGDRVWILDLRESDFAMGKYCWYPYDGPAAKANCFMEFRNNFYIGDDTDGIIYKEIDGGLNDGQEAINAHWTSPIIFCGSRSWTKDFEELHIVFGPQARANHTLSFITDDGQEDVPLENEAARVFTYADISYGEFTYSSNPYPSKQTELVGYSAEYLQWIIANNELNQGLTILSQELDYLWGERS